VTRVVGDEFVQIGPILPVEAGDIGPVEFGEGSLGHGVHAVVKLKSSIWGQLLRAKTDQVPVAARSRYDVTRAWLTAAVNRS
jgi:hypothetical protein